MTSQSSITLRLPAYGWPVAIACMELGKRVTVNVAKRHPFSPQGCFPMTD
jgi:hypothetical protein